MSENTKISQLIGKDLTGFRIVEKYEVYIVDVDDKKTSSRGLFTDPYIAQAYIDLDDSKTWLKIKSVMVLTDGEVGYLFEEQEPVKILDDESGIAELRTRAIGTLTPPLARLMGFE